MIYCEIIVNIIFLLIFQQSKLFSTNLEEQIILISKLQSNYLFPRIAWVCN